MHFAQKFRLTLEEAHAQLTQIPLAKTTLKPSPDKWSPIELIGHLIDSANNNHRRFTKAQWQDNLIFKGYAQENWVTYQQYQIANWQQLIDLWKLYNLHICQIMENTPAEKLDKETLEHNLHQIAWKTIPENEPATLGYFMRDYIGHLEHHLNQIQNIVGND